MRSGILLLFLTACSCRAELTDYPEPMNASLLTPNLRMEQSVAVQIRDREFLGRAVVRKQGDEVDLWILNTWGVMLAHYRQTGSDVEDLSHQSRLEGLDPRMALQIVRWSFFMGCSNPDRAAEIECERNGLIIREHLGNEKNDIQKRTILWRTEETTISFLEHAQATGFRYPRRLKVEVPSSGLTMEIVVDSYRILNMPNTTVQILLEPSAGRIKGFSGFAFHFSQ